MIKRYLNAVLLVMATITISFQGNAQLPGSGNAYDFNSSYLWAPNSPSLNPNFITIEAWIKADSWAANVWENVIVSKDGWQSGDAGYTLRAGANGTLSFNLSIAGSWVELTSPAAAMTTGQWYHVAGTFDGSTMSVYINGVQVATQATSGVIQNDTYDLNIGKIAYTAGGFRYFDGMIDEVRVWNSAIPQSSIQDYMCKKVTASHPQYASLAGYWNLDDVGTIMDSSPNGNNATNSGATQVTSGAAIGDESLHNYGGAVDLTLDWMGIDSVQITSASTLATIHLYRVDQDPNTLSASNGIDSLNHSHYYGVFASAPGAYNYDLIYHYGNTPMTIGNENYVNLAGRTIPGGSPWLYQSGTVDPVLNTVTKTNSSNREVMIALACPSINLDFNGSSAHLCGSETLDITDQAVNSNYQWHDGNGQIVGVTTNTYTIAAAGTYYLVANDGFCADTSTSIVVTAGPNPTVDFGAISPTYCDIDPDVTLLNATPSGGVYSGTGVTGNVFSPTTAGAGTYTLYYDYSDGFGCSGIDSVEITVNMIPTTPVIVDNGGVLCIGTVPPGTTVIWNVNGAVITSGSDTCITVTSNGDHDVQVISPEGCSNVSAAFTIDYIGISELSALNSILISPNPTNQFITISSTEESNLEIVLTDAHGRVLQEHTSQGDLQLDLVDLSSGIYFVSIQANGEQITKRIVKN